MKSLVFEDPLYNVNYLFAMLVACKLYKLYLTNPGDFAGKYIDLLKNGFDGTARQQLKKYMKIDLDSDQLLSDAVMLMREKTRVLETLYKE